MSSPVTVFGMSLATYTLLHTLIALVGIASGMVVLAGWIAGQARQTESPFVVSQAIVLVAFIVLAVVAALRFRGEGAALPSTAPK
jgi:hypothetical protein